jgi:uncharacterized protein
MAMSDIDTLRKAAVQGDAEAQLHLSTVYWSGISVPRDYKEAFKWCRKAAEQGNSDAQLTLGYIYITGQGTRKNGVEAIKWFRKAADQGQCDAQVYLGDAYREGRDVPQNFAEAVKWWRKAAEQKIGRSRDRQHAQVMVGMAYETGKGVRKNHAEAVKWYRKAAVHEDMLAQCKLGDAYSKGQGVPQGFLLANFWYQLACREWNKREDPNVTRGEAIAYKEGIGVQKDEQISKAFYNVAERNSMNNAIWEYAQKKNLLSPLPAAYLLKVMDMIDKWEREDPRDREFYD